MTRLQLSRFAVYASACAAPALASVLCLLSRGWLELADVVMVYLLGIVVVSTKFGLRPALLATVLSIAAYDFFCVPPHFTFVVADPRHVITFAVMFVVAVVTGRLTERLRNERASAEERERQTVALHAVAEKAEMRAEAERLRASLLSSVSHDLRTPLSVIEGAASTLLDRTAQLDAIARRELLESVLGESRRLSRLVTNLLDMTRIEAGAIEVRRDWQPIEEVIGSSLHRLEERLMGRDVKTSLAPELPLVPIDGVLIEQVLVNLLENVVRHTPAGSSVELSAHADGQALVVDVADRGPGLAPGSEEQVFEKFFRDRTRDSAGAGLGLTICRAIVAAHGGAIRAQNRDGGGARFVFTLPLEAGTPPPTMPPTTG